MLKKICRIFKKKDSLCLDTQHGLEREAHKKSYKNELREKSIIGEKTEQERKNKKEEMFSDIFIRFLKSRGVDDKIESVASLGKYSYSYGIDFKKSLDKKTEIIGSTVYYNRNTELGSVIDEILVQLWINEEKRKCIIKKLEKSISLGFKELDITAEFKKIDEKSRILVIFSW